MPQSVISICNMALGHIGRSTLPIVSLTEKSVEARTCQIWYDIARQEALELNDWSFARARLALALHNDAPPDEWAYRYQEPAKCLTFLRIWNPLGGPSSAAQSAHFAGSWNGYYGDLSNEIPFQLELSLDGTQQTILTNLASAIGIYTLDQELVQTFSPGYINTLAWVLASKIAYPLTGKMNVKQDCEKAAARAMQIASANDASQEGNTPPRDGYSARARQ